jgi:hypothetical protein
MSSRATEDNNDSKSSDRAFCCVPTHRVLLSESRYTMFGDSYNNKDTRSKWYVVDCGA